MRFPATCLRSWCVFLGVYDIFLLNDYFLGWDLFLFFILYLFISVAHSLGTRRSFVTETYVPIRWQTQTSAGIFHFFLRTSIYYS